MINKGMEKALTEGVSDLMRFMTDNPDYADIEWITINALGTDRARMVVKFTNGHQEMNEFEEETQWSEWGEVSK